MVNVKFKRTHELAVEPKKATDGSAAVDLVAVSFLASEDEDYVEYFTGLHVAIPEGYVGLIFPRSSISNTSQWLANSVGVIDSDYRGEIRVRMKSSFDKTKYARNEKKYQVGDRLAQMVIMKLPEVKYEEVEELSDTVRGSGGWGSTGK